MNAIFALRSLDTERVRRTIASVMQSCLWVAEPARECSYPLRGYVCERGTPGKLRTSVLSPPDLWDFNCVAVARTLSVCYRTGRGSLIFHSNCASNCGPHFVGPQFISKVRRMKSILRKILRVFGQLFPGNTKYVKHHDSIRRRNRLEPLVILKNNLL